MFVLRRKSVKMALADNDRRKIQFELFFLPVPTAAFMFMAITSVILAFVAFALLLHLAIFHLYINHVGKHLLLAL